MQNLNDIVNGTSDGTKDFSISALTCAGAVALNGNTTLGNATSDTITYTGRVASNVDPTTAATYLLGSATLPWQSISLDRGVTDGGAIYFDAGTTAFIKSDASHADLDLGGFTSLDLNAIALKGTGAIAPNATASVAIGTTSLAYTSLVLDNGATDGGAVYFNTGTSSFVKSSADGATFSYGAFTTYSYPAMGDATTSLLKWPKSGDTNAYCGLLITDNSDHRAKMDFYLNTAQSDSAPVTILTMGPGNTSSFGNAASHSMALSSGSTLKVGSSAVNCLEILDNRNLDDSSFVISKTDTSTTGQDFIGFFRSGDRNTLEGTIRTDGSGNLVIDNTSDERLKENIRRLRGGLQVCEALEPSIFDWKEDWGPKDARGFIAQEVEPVIPEAVMASKMTAEKYLTVSPQSFIPYIVSAIKELSEKVKEIDRRLPAA